MKEGDIADIYYVIKSGNVAVIKKNMEIKRMTTKESFGEQALFISSPRLASIMALDMVECLALGRVNLISVLGDKVQRIIFNNIIKWRFIIVFK